MLNVQTTAAVAAEAHALMYGRDSRATSRQLRRFLARETSYGSVAQVFTSDGVSLSEEVLQLYEACAQKVRTQCCEDFPDAAPTNVDAAKSVVSNRFDLNVDLDTASRSELLEAVSLLYSLAKRMKSFTDDPDRALYRVSPAYYEEQRLERERHDAACMDRLMRYLGISDKSVDTPATA